MRSAGSANGGVWTWCNLWATHKLCAKTQNHQKLRLHRLAHYGLIHTQTDHILDRKRGENSKPILNSMLNKITRGR